MKIILVFCLFITTFATAQRLDSLSIPGIPNKLYWEIKPTMHRVDGNAVTIEAGEKTDMFRDPGGAYNANNAPQLLFRTHENFIFQCAIEHSFDTKWDAGCLLLKSDSLNWAKFCFEKDYQGAHRIVSVVTKDKSDDSNSLQVQGKKGYFKIARSGDAITLYFSEKGNSWLLVRNFYFKPKNALQAGFLAQSPTGKKCTVRFSDISYTNKKIQDPYAGE